MTNSQSPQTELAACPFEPTEEMWGGLARAIMMWLDFGPPYTPRKLLKHLENTGEDIPQWLLDEPEMEDTDHSMSKGTRCTIVYKAMVASRPSPLVDTGEALREALSAAGGYLRNAKIDLETGATKATAIRTIEGGLKRIDAALAAHPKPEEG